jgi:hypothetical protein
MRWITEPYEAEPMQLHDVWTILRIDAGWDRIHHEASLAVSRLRSRNIYIGTRTDHSVVVPRNLGLYNPQWYQTMFHSAESTYSKDSKGQRLIHWTKRCFSYPNNVFRLQVWATRQLMKPCQGGPVILPMPIMSKINTCLGSRDLEVVENLLVG